MSSPNPLSEKSKQREEQRLSEIDSTPPDLNAGIKQRPTTAKLTEESSSKVIKHELGQSTERV
jgi:hypothetical protein